MMRDDKQLCLQVPPKSYIERHKIHENDQKTPNYIDTTHPIANTNSDTARMAREHSTWDSWAPNNHPGPANTNPHFNNNMLLYYESRAHPPRHQQFNAMGPMAHHHHPYGQMQFIMPQMGPLDDPDVQLQTPWHASSTHNPMPTTSYAQSPIFDDWEPKNVRAHPHPHPLPSPSGAHAFPVALAPYKVDQAEDISQPSHQDSNFSHNGEQVSPNSVSSDGVSGSESPGASNHNHNHSSAVSEMHGLIIRPSAEQNEFDWIKKPSYQLECSHAGKTRTKDKYRVVYSDFQRLELEKEFHYSRYITMKRKAELAQLFGLSERQVKIWFQNRRAKERKQVKKQEELVRKEKDFAVHHHYQQLQMAAVDGSWQPN